MKKKCITAVLHSRVREQQIPALLRTDICCKSQPTMVGPATTGEEHPLS